MDDKVARKKRQVGLIMLAGGALVYLTGLWPACHSLSDKGYFFATMVMSGFPLLIRQEPTGNERLLTRCKYLLLLAAGMLFVGLWNIDLPVAVKVMCLLGLGVSLLGTDMYATYSDDE